MDITMSYRVWFRPARVPPTAKSRPPPNIWIWRPKHLQHKKTANRWLYSPRKNSIGCTLTASTFARLEIPRRVSLQWHCRGLSHGARSALVANWIKPTLELFGGDDVCGCIHRLLWYAVPNAVLCRRNHRPRTEREEGAAYLTSKQPGESQLRAIPQQAIN